MPQCTTDPAKPESSGAARGARRARPERARVRRDARARAAAPPLSARARGPPRVFYRAPPARAPRARPAPLAVPDMVTRRRRARPLSLFPRSFSARLGKPGAESTSTRGSRATRATTTSTAASPRPPPGTAARARGLTPTVLELARAWNLTAELHPDELGTRSTGCARARPPTGRPAALRRALPRRSARAARRRAARARTTPRRRARCREDTRLRTRARALLPPSVAGSISTAARGRARAVPAA